MGNGSASILMNEVLKVRLFIINQIFALISLLFLALTRIKMFQRQIYPIGDLWRPWTRARYNRGNQKYRRSPPTRWLPHCWMWRRKKVFISLYSKCLGYTKSDLLFKNFVFIIFAPQFQKCLIWVLWNKAFGIRHNRHFFENTCLVYSLIKCDYLEALQYCIWCTSYLVYKICTLCSWY